MRTALLATVLGLLAGCGVTGPDRDATYRCAWPAEKVCEEYIPMGGLNVDHDEAERTCEDPSDAPEDYGRGSYDEATCGHAEALGRCVVMPGYLARRYYYVGFQGVMSPDDPNNNAIEAGCELIAPGAFYERPPFAD